MTDHAALIAEARRYAGSDGSGGARYIRRLADALEAVQQTPAVDTGKAAKAIWEVLWPGTSDVMDDAELGQERRQVARILFALTGSGILQDAAEVAARAWDEGAQHVYAEGRCLFAQDGDPCPANPYREPNA